MSLIAIIAVALTAVTIVTALATGQRLSRQRKDLFQVEMQAEQRRRRLADLDEDGRHLAGQVRALGNLRRVRQEAVTGLQDELGARRDGVVREIGVSLGLRQRAFEVAEVAA